jgi:hypothetical protein
MAYFKNNFFFNFSSKCQVANNWSSTLYGISNFKKICHEFPCGGRGGWGGGYTWLTDYDKRDKYRLPYSHFSVHRQQHTNTSCIWRFCVATSSICLSMHTVHDFCVRHKTNVWTTPVPWLSACIDELRRLFKSFCLISGLCSLQLLVLWFSVPCTVRSALDSSSLLYLCMRRIN